MLGYMGRDAIQRNLLERTNLKYINISKMKKEKILAILEKNRKVGFCLNAQLNYTIYTHLGGELAQW